MSRNFVMYVDTDETVGISFCDDDQKWRLHVKVCNTTAEAIPVVIKGGVGTPFHDYIADVADTTRQLIYSEIADGNGWGLTQIFLRSFRSVVWELEVDSIIEADGQTGPAAQPKGALDLEPDFNVPAGKTIELFVKALPNEPTSNITGFLKGLKK